MTLDDAKEIVRLLVEKSRNSRSFVTGIVMIAPMFCGSFKTDDIVQATGFRRNQVERAALNFWRYGIWTNDECWRCEWGRMFSGEEIKESEVFGLQICFILDVLVGEGSIERMGTNQKNFTYRALTAK